MSRLPWLNALLLVVVAALGALVYLKPGGDTPAEHPLSRLKPSEVRSIRIEARKSSKRSHPMWYLRAVCTTAVRVGSSSHA